MSTLDLLQRVVDQPAADKLFTVDQKIIQVMEQLMADADDLGISLPVLHDIGNVIRTRSLLILRAVS